MRDFEILRPTSLREAIELLSKHGDDACAYAGGTALLLAMRQRLLSPSHVVSLERVPEIRGIGYHSSEGLSIGALSRHADIARSPDVIANYPVLAKMAGGLANPQVRNQGTIGGNLCYADPATDPPGCLVALDAKVELASASGLRTIPLEAFLVDYFETAIQPGEILVRLIIPPLPRESRAFYARHLRTAAEHRPVANISFVVRAATATGIETRLVIGAATPTPQRMSRVEEFLGSRPMSPETALAGADMAAEDLRPISDSRGDGDFRRSIVHALVRRTIVEATFVDGRAA